MEHETVINDVQALIMRQLFRHEALRFSQINAADFPSDQLSYHLRQLLKYDLIQKSPDNLYSLSVKGRGQAILMDTPSNRFIPQGFIACRIVVSREHEGRTQYLMQQRQRVPYFGYLSEPGGKLAFGEDVREGAARNLQGETGLTGELTVMGLAHFKDKYQGQIVQDKFFFVIKATNPSGDLLPEGPTGKNSWMTLAEIKNTPKVHEGVVKMIAIAEGHAPWFIEALQMTEEY